MNIDQRIEAIRLEMKKKELDAYLIPSSDPHQSEYVAAHWQSRKWISGFTGSAGIAIITEDHAGLWTDSRYFLQAENELAGSEMSLHKQKIPHAPEHISWLQENLSEGSVVGCDGMLFSLSQIHHLEKSFEEKNIALDFNQDLINATWKDRPALPKNIIFEHDISFAGKSRLDKLNDIREVMRQKNANYHLVTTLDDIAWIFNIRSNDVECNPVTIAYTIVGLEDAYLFIDEDKVPSSLQTQFEQDSVKIMPYQSIRSFLEGLSKDESIIVDSTRINIILYNAIRNAQIISHHTISTPLKAIKKRNRNQAYQKCDEKRCCRSYKAFPMA